MRITAKVSEARVEPEFVKMAKGLLMAIKVAHEHHWFTDTTGKHLALGELYSTLEEQVDGLVESVQGKYGRLESVPDSLAMVTELLVMVESMRRKPGIPQDSFVQNQIDAIIETIASAKNKIENYK